MPPRFSTMVVYSSSLTFCILNVLIMPCSGQQLQSQACPAGTFDGRILNIPSCFFLPNTSGNLVYATDAIRACSDSDARAHLPFLPNVTKDTISILFKKLASMTNTLTTSLLFAAGYGLDRNRSSFYWYRNVRGYPEMVMTQDDQWSVGQPDNDKANEYMLAMSIDSLNDISASSKSSVICQLDPSLPLPSTKNLNGSIPSKPSEACPSNWIKIDKLYYYMLNYTFPTVSSAAIACKTTLDSRATLPTFRDWTQWRALLDFLVTMPQDGRPSTRHRLIPLDIMQTSSGKYEDTEGNWVFSDWLPNHPDSSDPNKKCVFIVDYNGYMWENKVCEYNESVLWAICQLNCSQPMPKCPNRSVDGIKFGLPDCYFQPIGNTSTRSVVDAIRECRKSDARSHLPFYPETKNRSILSSLFNLSMNIAYGNNGQWLLGGYGAGKNQSLYYWYRNVLGYPETYPIPNSFWPINQPDNAGGTEVFPSMLKSQLLNDVSITFLSGFVCQVDPSLPVPPENNRNSTFVSISSATCPSPWIPVGKLFYYLLTATFSSVHSAAKRCKSMDPRATLPEFRDYSQWLNLVNNFIRTISVDPKQPTTWHRIYALGITKGSSGQWQDSKGDLMISDWLPYYPNNSDPNKKCAMMVDYNGYMWENVACEYNNSILWALCQLNCSERSPNCPDGYIDGFFYNLPDCYFRPNTTQALVTFPEAIRSCQEFDARSHLPFYPRETNSSILANLYKLISSVSTGVSSWWFVGGYGTYSNRSSFYWHRNVRGYSETFPILDAFWSGGEPNNYFYGEEFVLSINTILLNDLPARYPSGFVCQVDPNLPTPPKININGSLPSSQSAACPAPWTKIGELYYHLVPNPVANINSAISACFAMDQRATLPFFINWSQWKALLNYTVYIPMDPRPSTRHRRFLLGIRKTSAGQWQDARGNWVFSDWLPYYPDESDPNKTCVTMIDYNGYMWENVVCNYNEAILWAFCQLNCSEMIPTTSTVLASTSKTSNSPASWKTTIALTTTVDETTVETSTKITVVTSATTTPEENIKTTVSMAPADATTLIAAYYDIPTLPETFNSREPPIDTTAKFLTIWQTMETESSSLVTAATLMQFNITSTAAVPLSFPQIPLAAPEALPDSEPGNSQTSSTNNNRGSQASDTSAHRFLTVTGTSETATQFQQLSTMHTSTSTFAVPLPPTQENFEDIETRAPSIAMTTSTSPFTIATETSAISGTTSTSQQRTEGQSSVAAMSTNLGISLNFTQATITKSVPTHETITLENNTSNASAITTITDRETTSLYVMDRTTFSNPGTSMTTNLIHTSKTAITSTAGSIPQTIKVSAIVLMTISKETTSTTVFGSGTSDRKTTTTEPTVSFLATSETKFTYHGMVSTRNSSLKITITTALTAGNKSAETTVTSSIPVTVITTITRRPSIKFTVANNTAKISPIVTIYTTQSYQQASVLRTSTYWMTKQATETPEKPFVMTSSTRIQKTTNFTPKPITTSVIQAISSLETSTQSDRTLGHDRTSTVKFLVTRSLSPDTLKTWTMSLENEQLNTTKMPKTSVPIQKTTKFNLSTKSELNITSFSLIFIEYTANQTAISITETTTTMKTSPDIVAGDSTSGDWKTSMTEFPTTKILAMETATIWTTYGKPAETTKIPNTLVPIQKTTKFNLSTKSKLNITSFSPIFIQSTANETAISITETTITMKTSPDIIANDSTTSNRKTSPIEFPTTKILAMETVTIWTTYGKPAETTEMPVSTLTSFTVKKSTYFSHEPTTKSVSDTTISPVTLNSPTAASVTETNTAAKINTLLATSYYTTDYQNTSTTKSPVLTLETSISWKNGTETFETSKMPVAVSTVVSIHATTSVHLHPNTTTPTETETVTTTLDFIEYNSTKQETPMRNIPSTEMSSRVFHEDTSATSEAETNGSSTAVTTGQPEFVNSSRDITSTKHETTSMRMSVATTELLSSNTVLISSTSASIATATESTVVHSINETTLPSETTIIQSSITSSTQIGVGSNVTVTLCSTVSIYSTSQSFTAAIMSTFSTVPTLEVTTANAGRDSTLLSTIGSLYIETSAISSIQSKATNSNTSVSVDTISTFSSPALTYMFVSASSTAVNTSSSTCPLMSTTEWSLRTTMYIVLAAESTTTATHVIRINSTTTGQLVSVSTFMRDLNLSQAMTQQEQMEIFGSATNAGLADVKVAAESLTKADVDSRAQSSGKPPVEFNSMQESKRVATTIKMLTNNIRAVNFEQNAANNGHEEMGDAQMSFSSIIIATVASSRNQIKFSRLITALTTPDVKKLESSSQINVIASPTKFATFQHFNDQLLNHVATNTMPATKIMNDTVHTQQTAVKTSQLLKLSSVTAELLPQNSSSRSNTQQLHSTTPSATTEIILKGSSSASILHTQHIAATDKTYEIVSDSKSGSQSVSKLTTVTNKTTSALLTAQNMDIAFIFTSQASLVGKLMNFPLSSTLKPISTKPFDGSTIELVNTPYSSYKSGSSYRSSIDKSTTGSRTIQLAVNYSISNTQYKTTRYSTYQVGTSNTNFIEKLPSASRTKQLTISYKSVTQYKTTSLKSIVSNAIYQTIGEKYMHTPSMYPRSEAIHSNHSIENPFGSTQYRMDLITPKANSMDISNLYLTPLIEPVNDDTPLEHGNISRTLIDAFQGTKALSTSKRDLDFLKKTSVDPDIFATWSNEDKLEAFMMDAAQISDFTIAAGIKDTLPLMYSLMNKSLLATMGHQLDEMLLSCTSNDQKCPSYNKKATLSFNPFFLNCYTLEDKPVARRESRVKSDLKLVLSTQRSEYLSISDKAGFVISVDDAYPHLNGYIANSGSILDISITQLMVIKNVGYCIDDENYTVDKCQAECSNRKARSACNCTDPRYCTSCDDACLPSQKLCLDQLEEKCNSSPHKMENTTCDCPNRCKTTIYNRFLTVSKLNQPKRCNGQLSQFNVSQVCQTIGDNVIVYVSFRSQSSFAFTEDFAYPLLQLISDIANTASLFTGVTLYVISEITFALILLTTGKWRQS